jgi:alpha-D-ribose 1-methylphosphonate 5-triphosphate synthase subunit PhnI
MSNPKVSAAAQIRRIERRRRERAVARIAGMTLSQQITLACDLWRIEQVLNARKAAAHA